MWEQARRHISVGSIYKIWPIWNTNEEPCDKVVTFLSLVLSEKPYVIHLSGRAHTPPDQSQGSTIAGAPVFLSVNVEYKGLLSRM